jgi:hypothetical protein
MSDIVLMVLRWGARIASLGLACLFGLMILGEFTSPHSGPPSQPIEWAGIALLAATCLGALLAWKWELAGGVLSLASLALFMILIRIRWDVVIGVASAPAILFLVSWLAGGLVRRARR